MKMIELDGKEMELYFYKKDNRRLKKELNIISIELDVRKREPYWEHKCIAVAKKYDWTEDKGFPSKNQANAWRREMSGRKPYIEIRGLREAYVIAQYGKLVDEDTKEIIIDPHNKILHHISSGTYNPRGFCKWDNVKIKHKKNDRIGL